MEDFWEKGSCWRLQVYLQSLGGSFCVKMTKMSVFLASVMGLTLFFLATSSTTASLSAISAHGRTSTAMTTSRKLKNDNYTQNGNIKKDVAGNINLEDYHLIDPSPSSKAAIKSGPIEHGTPLMPYIPQPTPPSHPKHGGSP